MVLIRFLHMSLVEETTQHASFFVPILSWITIFCLGRVLLISVASRFYHLATVWIFVQIPEQCSSKYKEHPSQIIGYFTWYIIGDSGATEHTSTRNKKPGISLSPAPAHRGNGVQDNHHRIHQCRRICQYKKIRFTCVQ